MSVKRIALLLSAPVWLLGAAAPAQQSAQATMLPERILHCTLGRAVGLDPSKPQTMADITLEGAHSFVLRLPSVPQHRGEPPEPSADPEPIAPGTAILTDPAGIAQDMTQGFYRVGDLWPQRVEMIGLVDPAPTVRLIIVSDIDETAKTANLFTTRAIDAATLDLDRVFEGGCRIEVAG